MTSLMFGGTVAGGEKPAFGTLLLGAEGNNSSAATFAGRFGIVFRALTGRYGKDRLVPMSIIASLFQSYYAPLI